MNLTVTSSTINNCQIFQLQGKILSEEDAEILKDATSNLVLYNVIFDLEALTHINSTGIAVFVKTMTKCRIENGDLLFCAPNQLISTLFKITKMNDVFSMYDSLESATNYFK
ncbi:MAG: STAS domain-containing protein [Crocinitomicaceae bacterium]|jgi:anti-sigma B factor antagonist|nr:STAS domain-containing protein [Crocinitomicaceae bacterium]MDG1351312.1 STAS domain-containing protein [Crocinitomicaceae bacterium]MDG1735896.1 STAS domain-containing protein [Crocinitomicaceae bacterium]MDG2505022.1 STAS domain-containing protein [Crocinitomicaceae bacterium]